MGTLDGKMTGIGMTSVRTRARMIERLREQGIRDEVVLAAMTAVPRHIFVDEALAIRAYDDSPLPIGEGQTISQPWVVARMTELARDGRKLERVLEVGTGCGYQTAVLAQIADEVYTVERIGALVAKARRNLQSLKLKNVRLKHGDGSTDLGAKRVSDPTFGSPRMMMALASCPALRSAAFRTLHTVAAGALVIALVAACATRTRAPVEDRTGGPLPAPPIAAPAPPSLGGSPSAPEADVHGEAWRHAACDRARSWARLSRSRGVERHRESEPDRGRAVAAIGPAWSGRDGRGGRGDRAAAQHAAGCRAGNAGADFACRHGGIAQYRQLQIATQAFQGAVLGAGAARSTARRRARAFAVDLVATGPRFSAERRRCACGTTDREERAEARAARIDRAGRR